MEDKTEAEDLKPSNSVGSKVSNSPLLDLKLSKSGEDVKPGENDLPSYGLLVINNAYNEGKITLKSG